MSGRHQNPHRQRVAEEYLELSRKIDRLAEFALSATWLTIDADEQDRLSRQLTAMTVYRDVLSERIEAWKESA